MFDTDFFPVIPPKALLVESVELIHHIKNTHFNLERIQDTYIYLKIHVSHLL